MRGGDSSLVTILQLSHSGKMRKMKNRSEIRPFGDPCLGSFEITIIDNYETSIHVNSSRFLSNGETQRSRTISVEVQFASNMDISCINLRYGVVVALPPPLDRSQNSILLREYNKYSVVNFNFS